MATTTENTYVGNGSTTLYSFTFPYIEVSDVYVSINDVVQTLTTEYSFANATTISFVTAPVNGAAIRIYRTTSSEDIKSVFYPGSAIRAQDLNDNFTQNLYVTQESVSGTNAATEAAKAAQEAALKAAAEAEQAEQSAAQAAQDSADAVEAAESAKSEASEALNIANEAKSEASEADVTANQALDAVLAVVPFENVSDVASIPASPSGNDGVKVIDSTGIESFSPLSGLPTDFVGDPGIYVDIVYNSSTSTWVYSSYNANDPDDRYSSSLGAVAISGSVMTGQLGLPGGGGDTEALQKQEIEALLAAGSASVEVSETPPLDPSEGDLWWDSSTDSGQLYIYYTDGNSSQWVEASPSSGGGGGGGGDLQSVTDAGNTTTNGATFGGTLTAKGINLPKDSSIIQGPFSTSFIELGGNMDIGTAGAVRFFVAGTEKARFNSSGHLLIGGTLPSDPNIFFNSSTGTGSFSGPVKLGGTAAANEISEYEEGTWTPIIDSWFSNKSGEGKYTKIGNVVNVCGQMVVECIDYGPTNAGITFTLPFPIDSGNPGGFPLTIKNGGPELGVPAAPGHSLYASTKATGIGTPYANISCGLVNTTFYPAGTDVTIMINFSYTTNA